MGVVIPFPPRHTLKVRMSGMQWFRLYAEFATDPKVQSMDETLQRRFIMFLCLHCSGEYDRLTDDELAFSLRIDASELARTKDVFRAKGFITETGEISNWNKRQYKSDSSTERVRKHRAEKVKRSGNVSVTPSDTDTDTEKNNGQSGFDRFWSAYPKKVKRKPAEEIWRRKRLGARVDVLLEDVKQRLAGDERWRGGFVPDPTTYLNQERWNDELQAVKRPRVEGL